MFERSYVETIVERIAEENNPLMQVVVGPRQTVKSTIQLRNGFWLSGNKRATRLFLDLGR